MLSIRARIKRLFTSPLYPLLLTIYPVLFLYSFNIDEVHLGMLWVPLGICLLVSTALLLLLGWIMRSYDRAGVWLLAFLLAFFAFGRVMEVLPDIQLMIGSTAVGKITVSLLAIGVFLLGLGWWLWRYRPVALNRLNQPLNLIGFVLIVVSLVQIIPVEASRLAEQADESVGIEATDEVGEMGDNPDIYYLVFDRYGGNETLQALYGFDNSPFHNMLRDKGFYVADKSTANYAATAFSLASTLNMKYLPGYDVKSGQPYPTQSGTIYPMLGNYAVGDMLKERGYKIIHLGSWFWQSRQPGSGDEFYFYSKKQKVGKVDNFSSELIGTSMAFPFIDRFWPKLLSTGYHDSHYRHTEYQLDKFPEIVAKPEPKFVFVHMLVPHDPFIYNERCQFVSESAVKKVPLKDKYLDMVQCANKIIEAMIDQIKAGSETEPIIIVQSDEGPYPIYDWDSFEGSDEDKLIARMQERFRIQNAYYFPDRDYNDLYQDITPVNSFRIIFNKYFNQNFELLPDKNYKSKDNDHRFDYEDLTEELRGQ